MSCGVLCAGPGGQRCSSRAGGCGSSTKEDRTSVGRRLAVWSRPVSLLRRHFSTRRWVDVCWAQSKFSTSITTTSLNCQIHSMTLILWDISKPTRYAPRPHTLGGHQLGQCVRLRSGGAWRGLGAYMWARRSRRGQRVRGGSAGERDPADAQGPRSVDLCVGRPGEAFTGPVRSVPGPRHRTGHGQRSLCPHCIRRTIKGTCAIFLFLFMYYTRLDHFAPSIYCTSADKYLTPWSWIHLTYFLNWSPKMQKKKLGYCRFKAGASTLHPPQVFSLPKVSAKTKFKLTAHEGCRVRKVALVVFSSTAQEDYSEHTLVCLTNLGDMHLFNVPALRPQVGACITVC